MTYCFGFLAVGWPDSQWYIAVTMGHFPLMFPLAVGIPNPIGVFRIASGCPQSQWDVPKRSRVFLTAVTYIQ